jgi:hypothetical protein
MVKRKPGQAYLAGFFYFGAGGRNRTDMPVKAEDFESSASTSFTTPAVIGFDNHRKKTRLCQFLSPRPTFCKSVIYQEPLLLNQALLAHLK